MKKLTDRLGRSWVFALGVLTLATFIAGFIMWQDQRQHTFVIGWWTELAKWLVLGTGGIKAGQKGLVAIAGAIAGKKGDK